MEKKSSKINNTEASEKEEKKGGKVKPVKVILVTGGVFMCGVGLYYLLKGRNRFIVDSSGSTDISFLETINPIKKSTSSSTSSTPKATTTTTTTTPATQSTATINYKSVAEEIRKANYDGNVYKVSNVDKVKNSMGALLAALKKINSVKEYELVNREYIAGTGLFETTKSIVTHSLEVYGVYNAYRAMLVTEFLRIGLKQNPDGKWSLSGLFGLPTVFSNVSLTVKGEGIKPFKVPANTLLGEELQQDEVLKITKIRTPSNKVIFAPTESLIKIM